MLKFGTTKEELTLSWYIRSIPLTQKVLNNSSYEKWIVHFISSSGFFVLFFLFSVFILSFVVLLMVCVRCSENISKSNTIWRNPTTGRKGRKRIFYNVAEKWYLKLTLMRFSNDFILFVNIWINYFQIEFYIFLFAFIFLNVCDLYVCSSIQLNIFFTKISIHINLKGILMQKTHLLIEQEQKTGFLLFNE